MGSLRCQPDPVCWPWGLRRRSALLRPAGATGRPVVGHAVPARPLGPDRGGEDGAVRDVERTFVGLDRQVGQTHARYDAVDLTAKRAGPDPHLLADTEHPVD